MEVFPGLLSTGISNKLIIIRKELAMAKNAVKTTKPVASKASKVLQTSKSKFVKSVAASALCNTKKKTK